jgi:alpha-L-glutamate ligase-like protein
MSFEDVLGMNRRNIEYIMCLNQRRHFALVDDKLLTKRILVNNGITVAKVLGSTDSFFKIDEFIDTVSKYPQFVIKPARGAGGSGIAVVTKSFEGYWHLADGSKWDREKQQEHVENVLYGTYSLDTQSDTAFAEDLIKSHPDVRYFTEMGLPDIRIILHKGRPIASMLRVPTRQSKGKANLHAGGFALAIDINTGITGNGWYQGAHLETHPETMVSLAGKNIPYWDEIISTSRRLYDIFPLGYIGADFVVDAVHGPLILELNARPGLEIQNVTGRGMRSILEGGTS